MQLIFIAFFSFFHFLYQKLNVIDSKDVKFLFLALSIINKTWMHYQKCCFTLYSLVDHLNHTKSYLRGGRITQDTGGYLVLRIILSPTYGVDG